MGHFKKIIGHHLAGGADSFGLTQTLLPFPGLLLSLSLLSSLPSPSPSLSPLHLSLSLCLSDRDSLGAIVEGHPISPLTMLRGVGIVQVIR